jgi:hypothetical protein
MLLPVFADAMRKHAWSHSQRTAVKHELEDGTMFLYTLGALSEDMNKRCRALLSQKVGLARARIAVARRLVQVAEHMIQCAEADAVADALWLSLQRLFLDDDLDAAGITAALAGQCPTGVCIAHSPYVG